MGDLEKTGIGGNGNGNGHGRLPGDPHGPFAPLPLRATALDEEIRTIEEQIARFRSGELPPEKFRAFRLIYGIYGQRQAGVQMLRVKVPGGVLNARQLEAFATVAENYGHGIAHITTRQAVQFHYLQLEDLPSILRIVGEAGLTSREACMNSVRNVTTCPHSGVCRDEPFPVLPYAQAVARFLMRHPGVQLLSRKFKIAFSGCLQDCASGAIHDIGAIAVVREGNGGAERGFRLLVGGGLGATPYLAEVLDEFVPAHDILRAAEAIVRVFSLHGNRRNKAKARLKFVVASQRIEGFRQHYQEARDSLRDVNPRELALSTYLDPDEVELLDGRWPTGSELPPPLAVDTTGGDSSYALWVDRNTVAQRDPGLRAVTVAVPLGDIRPPEIRQLARIARDFGNDAIRTTIQQNLLLHDVPVSSLPALHRELTAIGLAAPRAGTALDVTSCPGADTCGLGITSSKGLAREIMSELEGSTLPPAELRGLQIKISGCPNGCGQHHVGNIGLHGVARNVQGRQAPGYQLHLGGRIDGKRNRIARPGLKIPARSAPEAVRRLIELYVERREDNEDLPDFLARAEIGDVKAWLGDLLETGNGDFIDWGQTEPFSTDAIIAGECAGAGVDITQDPFDEAVISLGESRLYFRNGLFGDALAELNRTVLATARILLAAGTGKVCASDWETICEFGARLVDRGHASENWNELRQDFDSLLVHRGVAPESVEALYPRTESFLRECRTLLAAVETWKADPDAVPLPGLKSHTLMEEDGA